jgi:hypothetical protein
LKCYRDGRKPVASLIVLGGQVNLAEQQFIAGSARGGASADNR